MPFSDDVRTSYLVMFNGHLEQGRFSQIFLGETNDKYKRLLLIGKNIDLADQERYSGLSRGAVMWNHRKAERV